MSVSIGLAPDFSLLLWPWALYTLLASLLFAALAVGWLVLSRRRTAAAALAALCLLGAAMVAMSVVVPPRVYAYVLGGYQASPSQERRQELASPWHRTHEEITAVDWLVLSRQWGVCHGLWSQSACVAAVSADAEGIARELITVAAHGG